VKEKTIVVPCGEGEQPVKWLGHVGVARYDSQFGIDLGKWVFRFLTSIFFAVLLSLLYFFPVF
jgi:hypothetical protein